MTQPPWTRFRRLRRRGAGLVEYGALLALLAVAVLGAVVLQGERTRSTFDSVDLTAPGNPGGGGGSGSGGEPGTPAGQGAWFGDQIFALTAAGGSQSRAFVLTNVGAGPLTLGAPTIIAGDAGAFTVSATDCPAELPPGESCEVTILASATGNGSATARLGAPGVAATLLLTRSATGYEAALAWSGDTLFRIDGAPPSPLPAEARRILTLSNLGLDDARDVAPAIVGPGAEGFRLLSSTCPPILAPGASCTVEIAARASAEGSASALLTAGSSPAAETTLSALAEGFSPRLAWIGDGAFSIDAPTGVPSIATRILTLLNDGTAPATGIALTIDGDPAFQIASTTCGQTLGVGQSCQATLAFTAQTNQTGLAGLLSTGGGRPAYLTLSGSATGFAPALAWSGIPTFAIDGTPGSEPLPRAAQQTFTLTNAGTAPATGLSVGVSGQGFAAGLPATTCTTTLAVGASCTFTVEASPTADGAFAGALSSGGATPAVQPLSATATGFAPAFAFDATPDGTFAIANPATSPATDVETFTLRNTGTLAGAAPAPIITGINAADYGVTGGTCASQTLAPNATCTVQVTFTASANVAGRAATLSAGAATKAMTGSAAGFAPALAWSGTTTFVLDGTPGPQPLPRTAQQTFTLTNAGTAPATGLSVGVSGAGFAASANTCTTTLGVGQSCSLTITASASADGAFAGMLSSGGLTPATQPLSATATGFAPALAWSGVSTFAIDGTPGAGPLPRTAQQTFTLTNAGTAQATGLSVGVSGAGFAASANTCTTTLDVGQSCTIAVTASAAGNGAFAGTLSSGGLTPATQPLSATATGFVLLLTWTDDGVSMDTPTPPGSTRTYTLTNTGTATSVPLAGQIRLEGTGAPAFTLASNTCTGALAAAQQCAVAVRLAAASPVGSYAATLRADVPGGTTTIVEASVVGVATPAPFSIAPLANQPGNTLATSASVTPTGFNVPIALSVSGTGTPQVSTDGGATWATSGTLTPGGAFRVRLQTGTPNGGVRSATVVAGGRSAEWTVGVIDQTPNAFAFAARTGEELSSTATSDAIAPTGYAAPAPASVSGEGSPQISIGGGPWTTTGTISPGQSVAVRLQTASAPLATRSATITIGGIAAAWTVTTGGIDATPDSFTITGLTGQTPDAVAISAPVLPAGFDAPADLSVSGQGSPQISVNGGSTWAASARLRPGQPFLVRLTAGPEGTTRSATVVAGGVSSTWTVQARLRDTAPDPFAVPTLSGQPGNTVVESAAVLPIGYTDTAFISTSATGAPPEVSVDGGPWTTTATISPGQSFRLRALSPEPDAQSRTIFVSIGGVFSSWIVQTIDTMHDPIAPYTVANVPIGNCIAGPLLSYTGFTSPAPFTAATNVSGAAGISGSLTSAATGVMNDISGFLLSPGQAMQHRLCASPGTPTGASAVIAFNIGGRITQVTATTVSADHSPDLISIAPVSNATPGAQVVSAAFQIPGISTQIPIGFASEAQRAGASIRVNGGPWLQPLHTATNGTSTLNVGPADSIQLLLTAPAAGQSVFTTLRIGSTAQTGGASYTAPWTVSSAAPDSMPDPWPDLTVSRAPNNQFAPAAWVSPAWPNGIFYVSGINVPVTATIELLSSHPGNRPFWLNCEGEARGDGTNGTGFCGGQSITILPNQGLRPVVTSSQVPGEVMQFRITIGLRSQTFTVTSTGGVDITPDAFSIPAIANAEPGQTVVSAPITPAGLAAGATTRVAVSGAGSPEISIDGGPWIQAGLLTQGQSVRVRLTSAPLADGTTRTATLAVGSSLVAGQSVVSAPFSVATIDRTPAPLSFPSAAGVEPGVAVESASATVSGLGTPVAFTIAGGEASVDGGPFASSGSVSNGQTIRLRLTAGTHGEIRTATLAIGAATATFSATARALDATPDTFSIPGLAGMPADILLQSSWVRPTGLLDPAPFSVAGGEILPDGGAWTASGVLDPGQRFRVRLTSAPAGQTATATVTIGGVSADFVVTSAP